MIRYVLDSWAVLHLLDGDQHATEVEAAVNTGEAAMSWVNLGEVDYVVRRRHGAAAADAVVDDVRTQVDVRLPDVAIVRDAARIKAAIALAYADAFTAALAARLQAPILTGNPELLIVPDPALEIPTWSFIDLR